VRLGILDQRPLICEPALTHSASIACSRGCAGDPSEPLRTQAGVAVKGKGPVWAAGNESTILHCGCSYRMECALPRNRRDRGGMLLTRISVSPNSALGHRGRFVLQSGNHELTCALLFTIGRVAAVIFQDHIGFWTNLAPPQSGALFIPSPGRGLGLPARAGHRPTQREVTAAVVAPQSLGQSAALERTATRLPAPSFL
jgi:hypothetical protein